MIEAVSNISGKKQIRAMDKVSQEKLYDPGLYAMNELQMQPAYRRKDTFLQFLSKVVLAGIVVTGGSVLARKYVSPIKAVELDVKPKKIGAKIKYYVAKLGDWTERNVAELFKSEKKEKAQKATADSK